MPLSFNAALERQHLDDEMLSGVAFPVPQ